MGEQSLRERKKRETRQRISDAATMLFLRRGFDDVTVAEVADAAEVSKMTVFNYFPRKEDMLFDRDIEAADLLTEAITTRPPEQSVLGAVHEMLRGMLLKGHPLLAVGDGFERFHQVVVDSPALQARATELVQRLENTLTGLIGESTAAAEHDPMPRMIAALSVAVWRAVYLHAATGMLARRPIAELRAELETLLDHGFDGLRSGFPDYGVRSGH